MRVLLIEDDKAMSSFLLHALKEEGYVADHAANGEDALSLARVNKGEYSCILLDIMLPGTDGLKICRTLRSEQDATPILMITSRDQIDQKIEGLDSGADDYLTKPFSVEELAARIRALHRRHHGSTENILSVRHVELDPAAHEVYVHGKTGEFTHREFRLLQLLMENKGKVVTRSVIIEKVWDLHGGDLFSNSVNVHIKELRKKIQDDARNPLIITIRGAGYKFAPV